MERMERKERGTELGEGKGGRAEGRDRAPKLLLNQGPSEPCYATDVDGDKEYNLYPCYMYQV